MYFNVSWELVYSFYFALFIFELEYIQSPNNSTSVLSGSHAKRYAYDKICDLLF